MRDAVYNVRVALHHTLELHKHESAACLSLQVFELKDSSRDLALEGDMICMYCDS
jgi:hypothetical protein